MDGLKLMRSVKISKTPVFDLFLTILFALGLSHMYSFPPTLMIILLLSLSIPIHVLVSVSTETTRFFQV